MLVGLVKRLVFVGFLLDVVLALAAENRDFVVDVVRHVGPLNALVERLHSLHCLHCLAYLTLTVAKDGQLTLTVAKDGQLTLTVAKDGQLTLTVAIDGQLRRIRASAVLPPVYQETFRRRRHELRLPSGSVVDLRTGNVVDLGYGGVVDLSCRDVVSLHNWGVVKVHFRPLDSMCSLRWNVIGV